MEIEKRAFIKNKDQVISKLIEIGAIKQKNIHIIDYWICKKDINTFEGAQQHEPGSYALRVRKNILPSEIVWELNCKILEKEGDHNAFHEIESVVKDGEAVLNVLKSTEFKVFCELDKEREVYKLNNISINIENIKGFKPAIELEIIDDKNIEENKQILDNLLQELGIETEDLIEKSITYLYMTEFSFKQ